MMILLAELTNILREVLAETYHEENPNDNVSYPYATFDVAVTALELNQDGVDLTVDVFDYSTSWARTMELTDAFRAKLTRLRHATPDINMMFAYLGETSVPAEDVKLKHRSIRYYIKTDWRTLNYDAS